MDFFSKRPEHPEHPEHPLSFPIKIGVYFIICVQLKVFHPPVLGGTPRNKKA